MATDTLINHRVVVTGETQAFSRAVAREMVEKAGGVLAGVVDAATTILVIGGPEHISARKIAAAQKHGARIMTDAEFMVFLTGEG